MTDPTHGATETADTGRPGLRRHQALIGGATLLLAALLAAGAVTIPSAAGYAGVGPDFLPWVVAAVLGLCGGRLLWQAYRGGWTDVQPPSGEVRGDWRALAWVAAGVVANASLITRIGFVLACTLCFMLAVRGLRLSEGRAGGGVGRTALDALIGACIALPVYWVFGQVLSISLPGLTGTGWL
jgi:putative tricarboxylic transport membrane protein